MYVGVSGMLVGHPFDTVKVSTTSDTILGGVCLCRHIIIPLCVSLLQARLQIQGVGGIPMRYRGTIHCFSDIIKTEGVSLIIVLV